MAFGKAVFAEALDLFKAALGKVGRVTARGHPADQLFLIAVHRAHIAERRHRPAQPVSLRGGEAGGNDRQLHRLFLKQRHAQRLFQHIAQLVRIVRRGGRGVVRHFLAIAAAQIGVDHAALDRAGADDGDLDH